MFTTLDGFIAGPRGEFDDYEPSDEEMLFANEFFGSLEGIMFGRTTYQQFTEYWNALDLEDESVDEGSAEFARIFRRTSKVVFSRTMETVPDATVLIGDDLEEAVQQLKRRANGDFALVCGPELVAALAGLGLIDELLILVKRVAGTKMEIWSHRCSERRCPYGCETHRHGHQGRPLGAHHPKRFIGVSDVP